MVILAQRTIGCVAHDQVRGFIFNTKIQNSHNIGMLKASNGTCFRTELFHVIGGQLSMQYFNCGLRTQIKVFSQVHFGETSLPQKANDTIVAKLLSHAIGHARTSSPSSRLVRNQR